MHVSVSIQHEEIEYLNIISLETPVTNVCVCVLPVITGTVITAVVKGGSMYATVSIINVYKEGNLAIQQAGKTMSTKIIILCKKCPLIRRGEFPGEMKLAFLMHGITITNK